MKALADMEIQTLGKRYPIRVAVMAKPPDALRLEAIPPIGPPDFVLTVRSNRLRVFLPGKGEFYTGEASRHLSRFMPLSVAPEDIVSILLGTYPPLGPGDCLRPAVSEGDLKRVDIRSRAGEIRMTLWIKGAEELPVRMQAFDSDGQEDYSVVFSDWVLVDRDLMPEKIVVRKRGASGIASSITFRYTDMDFSDETEDASVFEMPIPPGARSVDLTNGE